MADWQASRQTVRLAVALYVHAARGGDGGNTLNAPRTVHSFVREMSSLMLHLSTSVHDGNIVPRWWPSWRGGGQRVHDYWTDAKRN